MLLPVFSIAQPPTSTVILAQPFIGAGMVVAIDDAELLLVPRSTAFSATVHAHAGMAALVSEDSQTLMPYMVGPVSDMLTMGTAIPPTWMVVECEDAEQEFGEAEMFLVNQFLFATSPKPALKISGVTRDSTGVVYGGAVVELFRTDEDLILEREISDPTTGVYTTSVFDAVFYYITASRENGASSTMTLASSGTVLASDYLPVQNETINTLQGS